MHRIGIVGASGYMGGEALRVLLEHPSLEVAWATRRSAGPACLAHPNLDDTDLGFISPEQATPCDAVLLALPTAAAIRSAAHFVERGTKVVDLGAAFRLTDRSLFERVYGQHHDAWALAEEAVYGIPELREAKIREARLVANPGCYSSAAILGLAPLVAEGWIDLDHVVVDGLSGTAGAGAELARAVHHAEIGNNLIPYNAVGHRHSFEIEQELGQLAGAPVTVHFTPVYAPIVRGILDVCHAFPTRQVSRPELLELYREFYLGQPFVRVFDLPPEEGASWQYRPYPWVSAVAGTNHCRIGLDVDVERGRIVVLTVLDSLGKGGAQVGVENLNLMLGLPRTAGLSRRGLHP
ncbi:MAG: N-acetyl-gamma-glutamyl-phosphate reductase [Myxococcota bacterium]